jgi:alkylation response protein AidB-like acyl-CoA dehydrogenase
MWITNSPISDLAVVWAKDDEDQIRGMIVESDGLDFQLLKFMVNGLCGLPSQENWFLKM